MTLVNSFSAFINAITDGKKMIIIERSFLCEHSIILPNNCVLKGKQQEDKSLPILSFQHCEGIGLSYNNEISDLVIQSPANKRAIFNAGQDKNIGSFKLSNITTNGQISFIIKSNVYKASIAITNTQINYCECTHYLEQPQKYGVNVLQGALTIYNLNPSEESLLSVKVDNLQIGSKESPVNGSGVFIAGYGDNGGKTIVEKLHTLAIYTNGKIPSNVSDYITGAIFILNGAHAKEVITDGEIITYGRNDMVLDVWGTVDQWVSNYPIISYGPSGVGFVNFGYVKNMIINSSIQTYGLGARGYNQYDGTIDSITIQSIETFGDGSVGIQISKAIGELTILKDIITRGSLGKSLVKGQYVTLPAFGLSLKKGGGAKKITIQGNIETYGNSVTSLNTEKESLPTDITIMGEIKAYGKNSTIKNIGI